VTDLRRTTTALLSGLLDPAGDEAWREFDARFRPIVRAFAGRLGLSDADAEDVTQEVLIRFLRSYREGKYDRGRGRLSSWLISITQNCVTDLLRSQAGRRGWRGESAVVNLADPEGLSAVWEEECRRSVLQQALAELRRRTRLQPQTIAAFEKVAFEQRSPADVASELKLSVDSVYAAKNRCLSELRDILEEVRQAYEIP
jgi:RNA polymerase sigma-70 factor (ECF subfamily)